MTTPMTTTSINVVSHDAADFFFGRAAHAVNRYRATSLPELVDALTGRLDESAGPATLDLLGHSTRDHHLLRLGRTPIDMLDPYVAGFFRRLAATDLLARLEITAVRLLGCETATTSAGQRTLRMLSHTLRRPVYGTVKPLLRSHHIATGFNPVFAHILVEASNAQAAPGR